MYEKELARRRIDSLEQQLEITNNVIKKLKHTIDRLERIIEMNKGLNQIPGDDSIPGYHL